MTVYSQHANRGKTQILATYQVPDGVVSTTVTSLGDARLAAPLVDALNRISALATVPISVHDRREGRVASYPSTHLAALTDQAARAGLLDGEHSLWYAYVCLRLHRALADLEDALAAVPDPVRVAVRAELSVEERELRAAVAEFSGQETEAESVRQWEFDRPFVKLDDGLHDGTDTLSSETREELDDREEGLSAEERERAVAHMRVLVTAHARCTCTGAVLDDPCREIYAEPADAGGYFVTVQAPKPGGGAGAGSWEIEIGRWEPDEPEGEDGEIDSALGSTVVRCVLPASPGVDDLTGMLNAADEQPHLLGAWADTPVGAALDGTKFRVTKRFEP